MGICEGQHIKGEPHFQTTVPKKHNPVRCAITLGKH